MTQKNLMRVSVKVIFLLSVWCFVVSAAVRHDADECFHIRQETDKVAYTCGPCSVGKPYGQGSLWVRQSDEGEVLCLLHKGDFSEQCYKIALQDAQFCSEKRLNTILKNALSEIGAKSFEQILYEEFPTIPMGSVPKGDLLCAAVRCIKESLSGEDLTVGAFDEDFKSWACFFPKQGKVRRTILKDVDRLLSVFLIQDGEKSRPVVIYEPDYGLGRLSYCCDLEKYAQEWPENWWSVLGMFKRFSQSAFTKAFAEDLFWWAWRVRARAMMIQAFLTGRCAAWDEPVWFVWRPAVQESDDILQVKEGHTILRGSISEGRYLYDTVWAVPFGEKRALRYRPRKFRNETPVFQFFPGAKVQPEGSAKMLCSEAGMAENFENVLSFILDYPEC